MKVLFAEDNEPYRLVAVRECKRQGLDVTAAANGIEAIELLKNNDYDVAVLDYNMPGKSGIDVIEFIKENKPEMPTLLISAIADSKTINESKLLANLYFKKDDLDLKALPNYIKTIGVLGKYA